MAHDVFISYATEDKPIADAVVHFLERSGIRCWIASRDSVAGVQYGESIIEAINSCELMVLVLSSHSNGSEWVIKEVERAASKSKVILPVRVEDVQPSGAIEFYIAGKHWLDAIDRPMERHLDELCVKVRALVGRSRAATDRPAVTASPAATAAGVAPRRPTPRARPARAPQPAARPSRTPAFVAMIAIVALGAGLWWMTRGESAASTAAAPPATAADEAHDVQPPAPLIQVPPPAATPAPKSASEPVVAAFTEPDPRPDAGLEERIGALAARCATVPRSDALWKQLEGLRARAAELGALVWDRDGRANITQSIRQVAQACDLFERELNAVAAAAIDARRNRALAASCFRMVVMHTEDPRRGASAAVSEQLGTFVAGGGLAITSLGALHSAKLIQAFVANGGAPNEVELLGADAQYDLALVRVRGWEKLTAETSEERPAIEPLTLDGSGDPTSGPAWILCPGPVLSPKLAREWIPLERFVPSASAGSAPVRPLAIHQRYLGGLPIVDAEVRLVGVWYWQPDQAIARPASAAAAAKLWVSADVVRELVTRARAAEPVSIAARESLRTSSSAFGVLAFPRLGAAARGAADGKARDLFARIRCPKCKGTGVVPKLGDMQTTRATTTRAATETVACADPECARRGLLRKSNLEDEVRKLATLSARVAPNTKDQDKLVVDLTSSFAFADSYCWPYFREEMNAAARADLLESSLVPGRPVAFVVQAQDWLQSAQLPWGEPARELQAGSVGTRFIACDPRDSGSLDPAGEAVVFGTIAGTLLIHGQHAVVLERVLVVPAKRG